MANASGNAGAGVVAAGTGVMVPGVVEGIQKAPRLEDKSVADKAATGIERQGFAGEGKQDIKARLRRAMRDALEQMRIARRIQRVQVGKIGKGLQGLTGEPGGGGARAGLPNAHMRRRSTSVPLVPPKPKELDMATSIFMLRAVPGT